MGFKMCESPLRISVKLSPAPIIYIPDLIKMTTNHTFLSARIYP
jgi:hypothetical protein